MTASFTQTRGTYHFGTSQKLTPDQLQWLIERFNRPAADAASVLSGRRQVTIDRLPSLGPVVVKHYTRGGIIRHLVQEHYLKTGKTRCRMEFELLQRVGNLGVSVPEPVVHAHRGGLFYRAWLVTREIPDHRTLAQLSLTDEQRARAAMASVVHQTARLIHHHILHVDLHPGNVLIGGGGRVYLIDFDKGGVAHGSRPRLTRRYLKRWQRAVVKHRLPLFLNEMMARGLDRLFASEPPPSLYSLI
jgi:thiamine kinase-like enzyme